ncbi:MAG: tRNA-(ms[2]io[6]A)-hydroxylase [Bacteroidia bacterium]|nr:tRNA-(ms[2]io[6]A)-hydroxylase [Bacteroidia bacterium]
MLNLKLDTDPRWVKNAVENNIEQILTDHAYCELKAAATAAAYIVRYPEKEELVDKMVALSREEMAHFDMVHKEIKRRGFVLGSQQKDDYVGYLMKFVRKGEGEEKKFIDNMLFAAMIEARSCERFKVISDHISDQPLAEFYRDLMASEARHYTLFIKLAKQYADPAAVDQRWQEWLEYEKKVIGLFGKDERIHG